MNKFKVDEEHVTAASQSISPQITYGWQSGKNW